MAQCVPYRLGSAGGEVALNGAAAGGGLDAADGSVAEFLGLLAELSPQQRACVALRYVGEYTSPEIGELLGTSAGTVRVQLHRAHAALRPTIGRPSMRDDFDSVVADRFKVLDQVPVPDTWSRFGKPTGTDRCSISRLRPRPSLAPIRAR